MDQRFLKGEETRQRILEAAIEINQDEGPGSLSAAAISKRADISKSTLFHHYKSIQDVRLAVFEYAVDAFELVSESRSCKSLGEYLQYLGESILYLNKAYPGMVQAYYASRAHSIYGTPVYNRMKVAYQRYIHSIEHVLKEELKLKKSDEDISALAALIVQNIDGLILGHLSLQNENQLRKAWELFVRSIK